MQEDIHEYRRVVCLQAPELPPRDLSPPPLPPRPNVRRASTVEPTGSPSHNYARHMSFTGPNPPCKYPADSDINPLTDGVSEKISQKEGVFINDFYLTNYSNDLVFGRMFLPLGSQYYQPSGHGELVKEVVLAYQNS